MTKEVRTASGLTSCIPESGLNLEHLLMVWGMVVSLWSHCSLCGMWPAAVDDLKE